MAEAGESQLDAVGRILAAAVTEAFLAWRAFLAFLA